MMRMALRTAAYNTIFGSWTDEEMEAYLKEVGINLSCIWYLKGLSR